MASGISLANKCQLLFGFAVVVILIGVLSVPWVMSSKLIANAQDEVARQLADAWLNSRIQLGPTTGQSIDTLLIQDDSEPTDDVAADSDSDASDAVDEPAPPPALRLRLVEVDAIDPIAEGEEDDGESFSRDAMQHFESNPEATELTGRRTVTDRVVYQYARAIRESQWRAIRDPRVRNFDAQPFDPDLVDPLRAILFVDRTSDTAEGQLLNSKIFIIAAGIVGSLLAILVFTIILIKVVFSPVRELRRTAEKVEQGDLSTRSAIQTGDELQQLSEAFNAMLDRVEKSQEQLQQMNESLDLKVDELSVANVGLFESNRFKSEFLASISHELRTPLNSIIGFAELLDDVAEGEPEPDPKRRRYLQNILTSGRSLLEMINELLDMAKIEAGRMEVSIEPTSVTDLVEGLANILRPQAEQKSIDLSVTIGGQVPMIDTDPGKLQQILYNFVANALKFTPDGGSVTVSADRITRQDNSLGVRIAVADTGPGIPADMQDLVFEKFRQGDSSHTRKHSGTGLGLAICRELAELLGAQVSFVSEPGRGATFFVDVPQTHQPEQPRALMGGAGTRD
ncbi:MAG: HAMP domain-containing sensor histidine kinase [Planctomycetota bacterium]